MGRGGRDTIIKWFVNYCWNGHSEPVSLKVEYVWINNIDSKNISVPSVKRDVTGVTLLTESTDS